MSVGIRDSGFGIGENRHRAAIRHSGVRTAGEPAHGRRFDPARIGSFDESRIPNLESREQTP
ncbi:hypothetical protein [Frateuria sp. Soil773]|uniref:hypothetical protein n=1 Tax=Frateuria sp. Soil773 TaxID=1736407 RepID=UPI0012F752BF|nr:hypothetical protein [Frateuria sp. Soil773]